MSTRVDVKKFWKRGFLLQKGVFTASQVRAFRAAAYRTLARDEAAGRIMRVGDVRYPLGDLLSKEGLEEIVLHPTMREIAGQLLDCDPLYFGYSSVQIGGEAKNGLGGWHKDNRLQDRENPRGLDWTTKRFPLLRFGVYFQDHSRHSGGLAIRVGSNHSTRLWRGRPYVVPVEPGDVVMWTLTTTHSGYATRVLGAGNRALDGRVLRLLPRALRRSEEAERVAAFCTFAREGEHLDRYLTHLKVDRANDEMQWFKHSRFGEETWQRVRASGLRVSPIVPEYGTPLADAEPAAAQ